jgi:hypothetical protein
MYGTETFLTDRFSATAYRGEESGRVLYSMDSRGFAAPLGFDLPAIPDSLSDPDRVDRVTLVDVTAGTYDRLDRVSRQRTRYAFDGARVPACDPNPSGDAARKTDSTGTASLVGTDTIAGRPARHYRIARPADAHMAALALSLAGLADSTHPVLLVTHVWTCAPDSLLLRWVEATERVPQLDELAGYKTGNMHPVVCRRPRVVVADDPSLRKLAGRAEIAVATDLVLEIQGPDAETLLVRGMREMEQSSGHSPSPIVWRGSSVYIARSRLLSLDEEGLDASAFRVPAGYRLPVPSGGPAPAAKPGTRPARKPSTSGGR